jgi:transposase, IS4 family protein
MIGKATFVMYRGYDDNKMFLKLTSLEHNYVIRLTAKRKLLLHGKWVFATELCKRRKGKVKLPLFYKGKNMKHIFHM